MGFLQIFFIKSNLFTHANLLGIFGGYFFCLFLESGGIKPPSGTPSFLPAWPLLFPVWVLSFNPLLLVSHSSGSNFKIKA
jgi:hypothetical protein